MTMNSTEPTPKIRLWAPGLLGLALLLGCASLLPIGATNAEGPVPAIGAPAATDASTTGLRVEGNRLMSGGEPFAIRGVQIVGLIAPKHLLKPPYSKARERFGQPQFDAIRGFGANLVRFQVSQAALDPQAPEYDEEYGREVQAGVNMALANGLRVIVSMQHQGGSGADYKQPLPSDNTVRSWSTIAPWWKQDMRVMYELYNEPTVTPVPEHWDLWLKGGSFRKNPTGKVVGIQKLIDTVRGLGARNVIIVPALGTQKTFEGMTVRPKDPLNNLAYGFHSPKLEIGRAGWQQTFGYLADSVPLIMTEWAASAKAPRCASNYPVQATDLLRYLNEKKVGVNAFSFDLPGTLLEDEKYTLTNYQKFRCSEPGVKGFGGPGELLRRYYSAGAIELR